MPQFPQFISQMQHKWFPVTVIVAAAAWWIWHAAYARYYTILHVAVVLLSSMAIAVWFYKLGGGRRNVRGAIVGAVAAAVALIFVVLRPTYNGDMGVYGWQWRFARCAYKALKPLDPTGEASEWQATPRDYPRFLGSGYWAEVKGVELDVDWKEHPPEELWRREIGASWSAFAIVGDYAITQEQRGEDEIVSCYRLKTGEPVWTHADKVRFDPASVQASLGDIGPRATPTVHGDRVFSQGGTGVVNCLDARTGDVLWTHDTAAEFGATITLWGKAGSPLVVDDAVIISVGAPTGEWSGESAPAENAAAASDYDSSLVAFDIATGDVRWKAGSRQSSYASPVLAELAGERQIVVVNQSWISAHRADDGKVLWEYVWSREHDGDATCCQPVPLEGDRLFLSKGYGVGSSLLSIKRGAEGKLAATPLWQPPIKKVMKTKFSNVLVRDGYVYGLDDVLLECIELETGVVKWKKRRTPVFGHGQIMLIGNTILVLSETGELALVEATPSEYRELASLQALDDANVTWNNPAFAPPYLLVRNAREAVCYRLPLKN